MKPKEKKPETVFRIIDRKSGDAIGSYSRAYCDEFDFTSASQARSANCHGIFEDKKTYAIAQYKVTYTLISDDVDGIGATLPEGVEPLSDIQKAIDIINDHNDKDAFICEGMSRSVYLAYKRALVLATELIKGIV